MAEGDLRWNATGGCAIEFGNAFIIGTANVPTVKRFCYRFRMNRPALIIDQAAAIQLSENAHNATGAMDIFHMHIGDRWCHFAQDGHTAGQAINILHGEVNAAFMRGSEQMQDRVG